MSLFAYALEATGCIALLFTGPASVPLSRTLLARRELPRADSRTEQLFAFVASGVGLICCIAVLFAFCSANVNVPDAAYPAWAALGLLVAAVIGICDMAQRIIPRGVCWALLVLGAFRQFAFFGWSALVLSAAMALLVFCVCLACRVIAGPDSIGMGDVRAMPAVVMYLGMCGVFGASPALVGMLLASVGVLLVLLVLCVLGKLQPGQTLPWGPALALWLAGGVMLPVSVGIL